MNLNGTPCQNKGLDLAKEQVCEYLISVLPDITELLCLSLLAKQSIKIWGGMDHPHRGNLSKCGTMLVGT